MIKTTCNRLGRFSFFLLFLFSTHAMAWNALAHMVIANIAYQRLQPEVKIQVDKLVMDLHAEYNDTDSFQRMAYWADRLREQKIQTYTHWHYIDTPLYADGREVPVGDTDNAVWAINNIEIVVQNKKSNPFEHARFLAFLIHIVSDLHQPLHAVTFFSSTHPDGDRGGNLYFVVYNKKRENLHQLWDEGVDVFKGDPSMNHVAELTNEITTAYPDSFFGQMKIATIDPLIWVAEDRVIAKNHAYNTPENAAPSTLYLETARREEEQRVALAGYRLAWFLNKLLG